MVVYVSLGKMNESKAFRILRALQEKDQQNTYVCSVDFFLYLFGKENLPKDERVELRRDLMSICDKMVVYGYGYFVSKDIDFANLINMEVEYLDDA